MPLEAKMFAADIAVKDAARGLVTAVFATTAPGIPDRHGDVYGPGAIRSAHSVPVSAWNHSSMATGGPLPVGKANVRMVGDEALAEVQYFLDLERGREAFEVVRRLDHLEWSWGLDVLAEEPGKLDDGRIVRVIKDVMPVEISPVFQAAGLGTRTVETRSAGEVARREFLRHQRRRFAEHLRRELRGVA